MLNRTYNNIVRLLGFITVIFFIVAKVLGWTDQPWMIIWKIMRCALFLKKVNNA